MPRSDLEIEYAPKAALRAVPPRVHVARVVKLERLAPDVMRVLLAVTGEPFGSAIESRIGYKRAAWMGYGDSDHASDAPNEYPRIVRIALDHP